MKQDVHQKATEPESTALAKFIADAINAGVALGGEQVSEAVYQARLEVCRGCDKAGTVYPLPGLKMQGCTICGCPFATKPRWEKYFSAAKLRIITAECPHPDGNKWLEIELNLQNK